MSVKIIDNEAFYGFRVRRAVAGKLFQEYFSLKKDGRRLIGSELKAVEREARTRDEELFQRQVKWREQSKADFCFHHDGSVKGISFLLKREKSGTTTPIFQIGIASEVEKKIVCTSFSVKAHGVDGAWQKAVDTYAYHKQISKLSKLFRKLQKSMPAVPPKAVAMR